MHHLPALLQVFAMVALGAVDEDRHADELLRELEHKARGVVIGETDLHRADRFIVGFALSQDVTGDFVVQVPAVATSSFLTPRAFGARGG